VNKASCWCRHTSVPCNPRANHACGAGRLCHTATQTSSMRALPSLPARRQTDPVPFISTTEGAPFVHKVWDSGVLCFVGGLLQGQKGPITAQDLQQRSQLISKQMADLAEAVTERQRPTKRARRAE